MIIEKCDKCGKESTQRGYVERRYLYDNEFDLCEDCLKIYDAIEEEMAKMAIRKRQECEIAIQKEASKMMNDFEKKISKGKLIKYEL